MPRRLGQHFLTQSSILRRIAHAACPEVCETVVEIGPGRGALTEHLLPLCQRLIAIEVDPVLVAYLQRKFHDRSHLTLIEGDVLRTDLTAYGQVTVAGNLPYYITSPIAGKVLRTGDLLQRAVFLVQKEVAERMAAPPGTRDFGYLSVQCQVLAETRRLFTVPPGAFRPPPKVDSAVVELVPLRPPLVDDQERFLQFASLCFRSKRKTLRNNLVGSYEMEAIDSLQQASMRAEQIPVVDLVSIWKTLSKHSFP